MFELATFEVRSVDFGHRSALAHGTLSIAKSELLSAIGADPAFRDVGVEIVDRDEQARITQVTDVVEPRAKADGRAFPGLLSPVERAGLGRTHRLSGVAVVTAGEVPWLATSGLFVPADNVLETGEPGRMYNPYAGLDLVVLRLDPAPGLDYETYQRSYLLAGLKAARILAAASVGLEPDAVEAMELRRADGVPLVLYACQVQSSGSTMRSHLYGRSLDDLMPTMLHANELEDGALVSGGIGGHAAKLHTWMHQNDPVARGLRARHGHAWSFGGVILHRGHHFLFEDKQRVAVRIAQMASAARAEGLVFTLGGAGNNIVEVMLAIQHCEALGMKTVLLTWEHGGPDGCDYPLPYGVPEAIAIVSTGSMDEPTELGEPDRVVGVRSIRARPEIGGERIAADGLMRFQRRAPVVGAANPLGHLPVGCAER